jgi:hypothetical protein
MELESIQAAIVTVWVSAVCTAFRRYSDDESDGGHPGRGTGNPVAQLAGARCRE